MYGEGLAAQKARGVGLALLSGMQETRQLPVQLI